MLKLVNRTKSRGSRFTFCADLRDVASRIPLACPTDLSISLFLSLSPFFLRLPSPRRTPDSVAPTMENSHCLRGLSLPSIANYTPASPPGGSLILLPRVCSTLLLLCFVSDFGRLVACHRSCIPIVCSRNRPYEFRLQLYAQSESESFPIFYTKDKYTRNSRDKL